MAFMPDHVHLALRGDPNLSPAEIAEGCWRALNKAAGLRLFSERVYVGSFSAYTRRQIGV
jgi:REP element-mobilizing transposase RayT